MNIPFKLVRAGSESMHLSIPVAFRRANKLKPGDYLVLEKVKIIRAEDAMQLNKEPVVPGAVEMATEAAE